MDTFSGSLDFFRDCTGNHLETGDHLEEVKAAQFVEPDEVVINGFRERRYKSWESIHRKAIALMLANRTPANA